jgi:hypothetical protein
MKSIHGFQMQNAVPRPFTCKELPDENYSLFSKVGNNSFVVASNWLLRQWWIRFRGDENRFWLSKAE